LASQDELLLVATDRTPAFDYILDSEIPDKGKVLTQLSHWWFEQLVDIIPVRRSPSASTKSGQLAVPICLFGPQRGSAGWCT
jgi:hypothetical protein